MEGVLPLSTRNGHYEKAMVRRLFKGSFDFKQMKIVRLSRLEAVLASVSKVLLQSSLYQDTHAHTQAQASCPTELFGTYGNEWLAELPSKGPPNWESLESKSLRLILASLGLVKARQQEGAAHCRCPQH